MSRIRFPGLNNRIKRSSVQINGRRELVSVLVSVLDPSAPKPMLHAQLELEARVGIEPTNAAFAEPCLTTWLPRHPFHTPTRSHPLSGDGESGFSFRSSSRTRSP